MSASTADWPPLDVLIATHGRARLLARTLDSLIEAELPSTMRRVLVVENGPPSGAEDVCRARADRLPLDYMHVAEGNKSRALNTGVQALEPGLIYFVDDDVRVSPHGPEAYVDAAARYGPGHHFGGPVHVDRDDEPPELLRPYLPWTALDWYEGDEERIYDRPYFIGSNWAAYRDDVIDAGGYAESLGPGVASGALGDEMEMQQRLLDWGNHGVYLPSAPVWHHVGDEEWTIEWTRNRMYRTGVTESLLGLNQEGRGPLIAGARWGHWKDWAVSGVRLFLARALGLYPERGVDAEMRLHGSRGAIVGSRLVQSGAFPGLPSPRTPHRSQRTDPAEEEATERRPGA